jgi:two-component system response regulator DegU
MTTITSEKIRLLIADDHTILRQGLRRILEEQHDMEVVGEAATGTDAVTLAEELHPDIVIMDISMPGQNGIESARQISMHGDSRVLVLTVHLER